MPQINANPHLKNISRIELPKKSRLDSLRLDMNESVSGLPADFVKNIARKISPGFLAVYPEYDRLQEKIAKHNNLKTENICLSNGSDAAIKYIFDAYLSSQDKVLIAVPSFAMYQVYCRIFNARPVFIPYEQDLSFPKAKFLDRISSDIKIAVLVNPNNPTGTVLKHQEIIEIIKRAWKNRVLVIVDEAYFYFYPQTMIGQVKHFDNLVVLRTFSKLCGLAAARFGFAAACPEIIENLKKIKPAFDVNALAVLFAGRLLDNAGIIDDLTKATISGKKYLIQQLKDYGIEYHNSHANFILIKCRDRAMDIMRRLEEKNILVAGNFKHAFLKDYIRVTAGNRAVMRRFWSIFIRIWKKAE